MVGKARQEKVSQKILSKAALQADKNKEKSGKAGAIRSFEQRPDKSKGRGPKVLEKSIVGSGNKKFKDSETEGSVT